MLRRLANVALRAVQPEAMMQSVQLPSHHGRIFVVGAGKATFGMAVAIHKRLGRKIVGGYINVPVVYRARIGKIIVQKSTHPFPNAATVTASQHIVQLLQSLQRDDLVIGLWSGGGSSLFEVPRLPLPQYNSMIKKVMRAGATIVQLNTVRKRLSRVKGGQLTKLTKARMQNYYISDVIGDRLDIIASGPTVTSKRLDRKRISNTLIGSNRLALDHIKKTAKKFHPKILTTTLHGEARVVAKQLVTTASRIKRRPVLLLAGGETTVTVRGTGHGGRNQELALAALPYLQPGMSLLSLATDGVDGFTPQPVAGAVVHYGQKVPHLDRYLSNNDSYSALKKLGALLHTGPTGTNVGDIVMILIQ